METSEALEALAALGQETRLQVVRLLVRAGPDGLAAGEVGERLGVPPATLSFHLAHLTRAGLVLARRDGRSIRYAVDYDGLRALLDYLVVDCCQGDPRCCAPATAGTARARARGRARRKAKARR